MSQLAVPCELLLSHERKGLYAFLQTAQNTVFGAAYVASFMPTVSPACSCSLKASLATVSIAMPHMQSRARAQLT